MGTTNRLAPKWGAIAIGASFAVGVLAWCMLHRQGGGTQYLMVPVAAFEPGAPLDDQWDFDHVSSSGVFGSILGGTAPYEVRLYAPVNLPHGATVSELTLFYFDRAAGDIEIDLDLKRQGTGAGAEMARVTVATSGSSSVIQNASDNTISYPVVDASTYRVFLVAQVKVTEPSIDLRFYGARISFSNP